LASADLPGNERAEVLMEGLRQILAADGSSAAPVLGAETCNLYDDIVWARKLRKAFNAGLLATIKDLRNHLDTISYLPDAGASGKLKTETSESRDELSDKLAANNFFEHQAGLQSGISSLKSAVNICCDNLVNELVSQVDQGATTLQAMPEWGQLNQDHREGFFGQIEALKPNGLKNLTGLSSLLSQPYAISTGLNTIREEILRLTQQTDKDDEREDDKDTKEDLAEETLSVPTEIASESDLNSLIDVLKQLSGKLKKFKRIKLNWKTTDSDD